MEPDLEKLLLDLGKVGTRIDADAHRERWRFEYHGRAYHLDFYPRGGGLRYRARRLLHGNTPLREFRHLRRLQQAGIATVRAVALLLGFRLSARIGDALILEMPIDMPLGRYLEQLELCPGLPPRRELLPGEIGRVQVGPWRGECFCRTDMPAPWSANSLRTFSPAQWQAAWPALLEQIDNDQLSVVKRCESGDVLAGDVVLGGRPVSVIVKRPKRNHWWRYINEIGRGSRARRGWHKAWSLVARHIPTAWPLLVMERRVAGYAVDGVIVFEHIPGKTLAATQLGALSNDMRRMLLWRVGRLLRRIERSGLYYYDSKATNWMVLEDKEYGLAPLVVDVDGLRPVRVRGGGIARILRSVREHPDYIADDERSLMDGYEGIAATTPAGGDTSAPGGDAG